MVKLSICIPTYNRIECIKRQIGFFARKIPKYNGEVELLISDNSSNDGTKEYLDIVQQEYPYIRVNRNEKNIGLTGNAMRCAQLAEGEYIWPVGDDDFIYDNALDTIISILNENIGVNQIFLNHKECLDGNVGEIVYKGKTGYLSDGVDFFYDISTNASIGYLLFMSASVYKKENVLATNNILKRDDTIDNLAFPLAWAVYNMDGPIYVTSQAYLEEHAGRENKSWKKSKERLYGRDFYTAIDVVSNAKNNIDRINSKILDNIIQYPEVRYSILRINYLVHGNKAAHLNNFALKCLWERNPKKVIIDYLTFPFFVAKKLILKNKMI